MKIVITFFLLSILLSAQNKIIVDERTQKPMAIGCGDRTVFEDSSFANWFNEEYSAYKIKGNFLDDLSEELNDISITIVMGTWCGDSRREVPRFYKILDRINYPDEKIKLIFVDRKKQGLDEEIEDLNIELVPTIIFYKDDEEIGRIVETPDETLEEDFKSIVE